MSLSLALVLDQGFTVQQILSLKYIFFFFQAMQDLTKPHIDSFNWMLNEGLSKAVKVSHVLI